MLKKKVEIEVSDCRDCPFKRENNGHGDCFTFCGHQDTGRDPYDRILWGCRDEFSSIPNWCPLC